MAVLAIQPVVRRRRMVLCAVALLSALCSSLLPSPTAAITSWWMQPELTGNWGGLRSRLADRGVTFTGSYTADLLGNPVGGRRQRFRYAGDLSVYLTVDLEALWGIEGLQFNLSASWRSGQDLSEELGNMFAPAQIFAGDTVRLYEFSFEHSLCNDRVSILVGRIGLGDDFLASPLYRTFVSAAFNSNPISMPINLPGFTVDPVATWGGRVKVQPSPAWYVMTGAYNSNPGVARNSAHGVDFSSGRGALVMTEIGYLHNQREGSTGLPGTYKVGGYYDSSPFPHLAGRPDAELRGNYGFYVLLDQMVYREGEAQSQQGFTPFMALLLAPSERRNTLPFFAMGGLVYQGLFPGRDDDRTAFGLAYGKFSKALDGLDFELLLEWTHAFVLVPSMTVQPVAQYIIRPGGTGDSANALVLGAQIMINF